MSWPSRYVPVLAVVFLAIAAVGAVFAFARPTYHPSHPYTMVNMSGRHHYTVAQVRQVFASHEVRLARAIRDGDAKHGLIVLSPALREGHAPPFTVTLFGTKSTVSFGRELEPGRGYESRFGNVSVLYGDPHPDRTLLRSIEAAVADLQH